MDNVIYQQDRATLLCSNASLEYIHCYSPGDRLISSRAHHTWSALSPDLSHLDYFLWGYLKDRAYTNNT